MQALWGSRPGKSLLAEERSAYVDLEKSELPLALCMRAHQARLSKSQVASEPCTAASHISLAWVSAKRDGVANI